MELQFEKQELPCMSQVHRGVKDQEVTQEIRLTESMPDVGRVLAGWGQVILRGKEWQGSRMAVSGGIQAAVLYAPEDGGAPQMVDAWIPFQFQWDGADPKREGPMRVCPLVRFVDGRNLSARKILIRAGVSCLCEGLCPRQAEVFHAPQLPEDIQLLRRSYPVRLPREAGEKTFTLEQELEMNGNPVEQIISYSIQPMITEAKVSADKVVLRGCGKLHLVYRCAEGRIRCRDFEIPFSQLGELDRVYENDAMADVMMAVTSLELDPAEEKLVLKCGMVAQYLISDRVMLELAEDAYSPRREIGLRAEELNLPLILDETRERLNAQADVAGQLVDVADAVFWPGFPRVIREGDRAELEAAGRFQVLGYDADGTLRGSSARWEGKTGLNADQSSRVDAVMAGTGEVTWNSGGNGMDLRTDAQIRMTTISCQGLPMITGLELGPVRDPDDQRPSLILCRTGGRSLWSLAKHTGSCVSAIAQANGLDDEPVENRMILIPIN